jgi:hypothetical protein
VTNEKTLCIHGNAECVICETSRAISAWSIKELTRFMATDEVRPETSVALTAFMGYGE